MKIIFLDIDGVLLVDSCDNWEFTPRCVLQLKRIIDNTEAQIVLSSTWRHGKVDKVNLELQKYGIAPIFSITPTFAFPDSMRSLERSYEILTWLKDNPSYNISQWVAIDDEFLVLGAHSFQTRFPWYGDFTAWEGDKRKNYGLTPELANEIILFLNTDNFKLVHAQQYWNHEFAVSGERNIIYHNRVMKLGLNKENK